MLVILAKTGKYGPVIGQVIEANNQDEAINIAVNMVSEQDPALTESAVRQELENDLSFGDVSGEWSVSIGTFG